MKKLFVGLFLLILAALAFGQINYKEWMEGPAETWFESRGDEVEDGPYGNMMDIDNAYNYIYYNYILLSGKEGRDKSKIAWDAATEATKKLSGVSRNLITPQLLVSLAISFNPDLSPKFSEIAIPGASIFKGLFAPMATVQDLNKYDYDPPKNNALIVVSELQASLSNLQLYKQPLNQKNMLYYWLREFGGKGAFRFEFDPESRAEDIAFMANHLSK
jgi:hypothetical protein